MTGRFGPRRRVQALRIEVRFHDDVAIVSLSGKFLAGSDGPYLRQKVKDLIDVGTRMLVLDFAEVPYIDSTGLGFLAGSRVTTQTAGTSMVLASINEHVRKILDRVKLTEFFVIAADETAAVAKVREMARSAEGNVAAPAKASKSRKRPSDLTQA